MNSAKRWLHFWLKCKTQQWISFSLAWLWEYFPWFLILLSTESLFFPPLPSSFHPLPPPPFLRHISLHCYFCSVAFSHRYTHFCFMQSLLWEHFLQHLPSWNTVLWIFSPQCICGSSVCIRLCTPLCPKHTDSKTTPHSWSPAGSMEPCV